MRALRFVAILLLQCAGSAIAQAQQTAQQVANVPISFGSRGWGGSEVAATQAGQDPETPHFSIKAGAATDYVYRGTSLSDRKPAVGGVFEVTYKQFYSWASVASVRLPTRPDAELAIAGGVRPTFAGIDFDLGITYFAYPGEALPGNGINYLETALRGDFKITESWRGAAGFAYSPDVSNTGAWSWYTAAGLGYDVPARFLPADFSASVTAAAGYSWFGKQSPALGGFALPEYLNWHAGVTLTYKLLNLDLRYYDTNLTRENCFVFTGDPGATPGGTVNPITNPGGLRSNWCGATFVAKVWVALDDAMFRPAGR